MKFNNHPQLKSNVRSFFAVVAISIALPALAYADHGHDKDGPREDHGRGDRDDRQGDRQVPVVPEANAGWVLVPFFGAVLLFSARQLFRGKVTE